MPIMASNLYRDMLNFFRNQFSSIILLALLTAIISVIVDQMLSPCSEQLMTLSNRNIDDSAGMSLQPLVQQISVEQQWVLIKVSAARTFARLVSHVMLAGGLLTMIHLVTNHKPVSVLRAIGQSLPILPRLLLLMFLATLLVQLGLLIIVPGIMLAIAFSLAPIIATSHNIDAIKSMRISASLAFANFWLLAPAVFLWLIIQASLLLLATPFTMVSSLVATLLLNIFSNLISSLLLIYLYRLYMLLRQL
ncbi:YciC family protein [Candidatus Hoaglandella endobia]|uniref:UPF0259 membrane protein TPER_HE00043 n=1 Tax=Candidatus Hoaglandella endobia TaxID=1778263 RepID=A0A143WTF8_9ENTR|nr:YciC family protein [Candidatus Hoaglandella endobia]CUX96995.1 hypothetical protein TPER_HE00043 [Candidatus Hoaglandella endobia]